MIIQRQHFLLSYLKTLSVGPVGVSNSRPPASQPGAQPSEQPVRGNKWRITLRYFIRFVFNCYINIFQRAKKYSLFE